MPDVLIPWRAGCQYRERALRWVLGRWEAAGHRPIVGTVEGVWCKAAAVAEALERSTADTVVVADADVWLADPAEIGRCVEALTVNGWAIPHSTLHRLDVEATSDLIATGTPGAGRDQQPYLGYAGGGITVLRRSTYEACPLDKKFKGWGQEDQAWAIALGRLVGEPYRGRVDLWHLWHPPQERVNRTIGNENNRLLLNRYRRARSRPDMMRALIREVS